mgnify:FL=1
MKSERITTAGKVIKMPAAKRRLHKQKLLNSLEASSELDRIEQETRKDARIEKLLEGIRNLPKEAVAHQVKSRDHTVPKDSLMNRCLSKIESIRYLLPTDKWTGSPVLKEAWDVYMDLQNFTPAVGESQHWRPGTREFSLDDYDEEALVIDDGDVVETPSPEVRSGGLGYKHVNWDSSYLMAQPKGGLNNPYWRLDNAKKARKAVKHYTREEIGQLSGPSG